jgi:histidyl-tRNA synthetase
MSSTQPPRGMRDFLPDDVRRREHVIGVIRAAYERFGFEPLETPAVENIETLLGKYGEEGNKLIFKILKRGQHEARGEADLALRYDLTVPLARVVAEYQASLPRYFKRYQIQPVWRADRPARGRFREFYQCDVDALGSTSMVVEAELCAAVSEALLRLGFVDFVIRLNHRQVLAGVLDACGVESNRQADALVAIDKLDKIGPDAVVRELESRAIPADGIARLLGLMGAAGRDSEQALHQLRGSIGGHPAGRQGLADIEEILALTAGTPAGGRLRVDASLARGLSYYTGAILEIAVPDLAGSLGGGGRYDNLVGMFLGRDVPACGVSLGLERIIVVMTERGMFPPSLRSAPADVLVTQWSRERAGEALGIASELRAAGLRVEVFPDEDKLGKQFRYASARHVPFVVVRGDDERAHDAVAIKDMTDGAQVLVPRAEAARWIGERLKTTAVRVDG